MGGGEGQNTKELKTDANYSCAKDLEFLTWLISDQCAVCPCIIPFDWQQLPRGWSFHINLPAETLLAGVAGGCQRANMFSTIQLKLFPMPLWPPGALSRLPIQLLPKELHSGPLLNGWEIVQNPFKSLHCCFFLPTFFSVQYLRSGSNSVCHMPGVLGNATLQSNLTPMPPHPTPPRLWMTAQELLL